MLSDGSKSLIPNNSDDPHTSILHLEAELHKQSESCEKMSLSLKQGEVDMKRKDEEIIQQKNKVKIDLCTVHPRLIIEYRIFCHDDLISL